MVAVKGGAVYFALVFGVGFALGIVRQLWAVPRFGVLTAELAEQPFMLIAILWAARWAVARMNVPATGRDRLVMGGVALGLLLACELGIVLRVRGLSLPEYVAAREPVSGIVYLVMLAVFAVMPRLLARRNVSR
jgi:hypothetical protein